MKWIVNTEEKKMRFEIFEEVFRNRETGDSMVSYTLGAWRDGTCIYHDHQDTLAWCQRVALEEFNVPISAWKRIE